MIPRRWTAFESDIPPLRIWGNAEGHLDIPVENGTWAVAGVGNWKLPVHFAVRFQGGAVFAIGLQRYDYEDHYYTGPRLTWRRYA